MTSIAGSAVLVTGANRGIGSALVTEALARGAKRVYAGVRQPWQHPDERVTPLIMDVTSAAQVRAAARRRRWSASSRRSRKPWPSRAREGGRGRREKSP